MPTADVLADLQRRHAALGQEIAAWLAFARSSPATLGLHKSQLETIARAIGEIMKARTAMIDGLGAVADATRFGDGYVEVLEEIVGAGELWRIYQTGIEQHSVSPFKQFVHEATLIAIDIAATVYAAAKRGGAAVPALVFLDPALSPAAAGRFSPAAESGFVVRRFRAMQLPVPLVLVPSDQATSMWALTHLTHEVGHNIDQELGRDVAGGRRPLTRDLQDAVGAALLAAGAPDDRRRRWHRWCEELLADLFGVSLGAAAYGSALSRVLLPLATASRFATLDDAEGQSRAPHPPPGVRRLVLVALLRLQGAAAMADEIDAAWNALPAPAYVAELAPDVAAVAGAIWGLPLEPGSATLVRALAPFAPDARFELLVAFLAGASQARPSATLPDNFPRRYVPLAAELAVRRGGELAAIHDRALKFAAAIPAPQFAAGAPDTMKQRATALRFARPA